MTRPLSIDIVVPVFNAPVHAKPCLESVLAHTGPDNRIYCINDDSDQYTSMELARLAKRFPGRLTVIVNETRSGYLKSVNRGIGEGGGDIVVLVNSDTLIFPGTVERLQRAFSEDATIGIVTAVSTWANWTRIPFPAGSNVLSVARFVSEWTEAVADIYNASGFFYAVRRSLFEQLGLFDEIYSPGYWEEADYCMRALSAGYRVVVDPALFVFHHGWGSFRKTGRDESMSRNKSVFMERWGDRYDALQQQWRQTNPVGALVEALKTAPPVPEHVEQIWLVLDRSIARLDILCHFHAVNALILMGISVNVLVAGKIDDIDLKDTPMYFSPLAIDAVAQLPQGFRADIVFAHGARAYLLALSIQDLLPETTVVRCDRPNVTPAANLAALDEIKVSHGPADMRSLTVTPSVNTDLYYPAGPVERRKVLVLVSGHALETKLGAAQPRMKELQMRLPSADIQVCEVPQSEKEFAQLLRDVDVVASFDAAPPGDTIGLLAMASGAVFITQAGGPCAWFARHWHNCLLVDEISIAAVASAVAEVLNDAPLSARLRAEGRKTGLKHTHRNAADSYLARLAELRHEQGDQ